jgi:hypothetical protein
VLVVASLALSTNAVVLLRHRHAVTAVFAEQVGRFAAELPSGGPDRPAIVSRNTHLGRHVWRTLEDVDYLLVDRDQFQPYLRRFAAQQYPQFGFVGEIEDGDIRFFESIGYSVLRQSGSELWVFFRTSS